ncbi:Uncharacterised protein [Vibrio cholerae]|nr:Uncharacterised protein [Vibrio cholerae]
MATYLTHLEDKFELIINHYKNWDWKCHALAVPLKAFVITIFHDLHN